MVQNTMEASSKKQKKLSEKAPFDQVISQIESLVERLEQGDLSLEESLSIFEEGVRLSKIGNKRLEEAEQKVEQLLTEDSHVQTESLTVTHDK